MTDKGMLLVLSGPSGTGKGTLCNLLLNRVENLFLSVSATTRPPRNGEVDGVDYLFLDKGDFESRIAKGEFLEWAKVYNNYYGTPKEIAKKMMNEGKDVILEIDVQGAAQVKKNCPEGVFVFILPPSFEELKKRITKRGTETKESMALRLKSAQEEMSASHSYDYVVINDDINQAALKLHSIVLAERCKVFRNKKILQTIKGGMHL